MNQIGRPRKLKSATRRNIYIPDALWASAQSIGNGSACAGIRIALEGHGKPVKATKCRKPNTPTG